MFACVESLQPRQPNRVMSSTVSLPNHTFNYALFALSKEKKKKTNQDELTDLGLQWSRVRRYIFSHSHNIVKIKTNLHI